ncbi:hypothetical protein E5673_14235 [Sphingomonas sp. PAMC26645]|uniref:hypothetical protein n=1 Tax=Sphingomonas sp. PAMC26645 TaxID=2565555 RepID=UPI00109D9DB4|nr:hypothetical protein [Sphingomonas sp. PAMC26645]QCB43239.1 hypothetical protein E5673_14235 [Sphingomonas sp. PAMC26645]
MTYEQLRNPALPWGYWLHADGGFGPPLVDEQGGRWGSVRQAFFQSRLGMSPQQAAFMEPVLERVLAVLAAVDRRTVHVSESVHDLFAGESDFQLFYRLWLRGLELTGTGALGDNLTAEGHAALVMLASTRPSDVRAIPIGLDAIRTMWPLETSEPERSAWLQRVEDFASNLRYRFVRQDIGRHPGVALIGAGLGGVIPINRTLWSQTFSDLDSRDRFHVWLAIRLDRWDAWGGMAYKHGAPKLTQHLFALLVGEPYDPDNRARSRPASLA